MKIKILIVDDEENIRKVTRSIVEKNIHLEGIEIEIEEAENADRALDKINKSFVHIILLDVVMSGLDAFEFLKEIKRKYPLIQVIVITGQSTMDRVLKALEFGANDYIEKPIDKDRLVKLLDCTIYKIQNWKNIFRSSVL